MLGCRLTLPGGVVWWGGTGNHGGWAGVGDVAAHGRSQAAALQVALTAASRAASRAPASSSWGFSGSGRPETTRAAHSFLMSQQQPGASGICSVTHRESRAPGQPQPPPPSPAAPTGLLARTRPARPHPPSLPFASPQRSGRAPG